MVSKLARCELRNAYVPWEFWIATTQASFESCNGHRREATAKARLVTAKKKEGEQLKAPARTGISFTGAAEAA